MIDLCIVGAPRCATSSLFNWLTIHPQISGPKHEKELFFFMDDDHPLIKEPNVHTASLETYSSLFAADTGACTIEGTTHYLFQATARTHLARMESEPLIVVVLRDPARRVWSSFQYTRNNLARIDPSLSYCQYVEWGLRDESDRVTDFVSHAGSAYVLARDIEYGKYIDYLIPWRKAVGRERLFVLSFEEVVSHSGATCRRLASALGVEEDFYDDFEFEAQNTTYGIPSPLLQLCARRVGKWMPEGPLKQRLKQAYVSFATSEQTMDAHEEKALRRLQAYYAPYNEQLAEAFDLDVSSWS